MSAGSIVIDLLMKTGTFETDTARASKTLKKLKQDAEAAGRAIGLGFVGAVGGLAALVTSTVNANDHLNDLSQKTGIAADTLGGLAFAGKQAGLDLESVASGAGKLNKSIAEAASGNKEAQEAFTALGISVRDASGQTKNAAVVIGEVAAKFATYADGPEKAAIALRLFGKAGADMIPLLNGGAQALQDQIDYFKRYSGVTIQTARDADEFNDTLGKLKLLSGAFAQTLTSELLPTLKAIADAFLDAKEKGDGFSLLAGTIGSVFRGLVVAGAYVIDTFGGIGREIGAIGAQIAALSQGNFGEFRAISKAVTEDGERAKKELDAFVNKVLNPVIGAAAGAPSAASGSKPAAPRLPSRGGNTDDPSKRLFENQIKSLQASIQDERDLLQTRNRFLELYNAQGLISIQSYFDSRRVISEQAAESEKTLIDQEIALAEKRKTAPGVDLRERADLEGKIADLRRRRAKVEQEAGEDGIELSIRQAQAEEQLRKVIDGVSTQVLELNENFAAAAAIKFDIQYDILKKTFTAEGNSAGLEAIDTLRAAAIAQAAFAKASLESGRTLTILQNAEDRIAIAQQAGAVTSLGALVKIGEERRKMIPILEAQVAAEEAIAKASGNSTLIQNAEAARISLERLKAAADPLAESLNKTFGDDLNAALDDFVTGSKSAADAFKSFAKSVLNDILKLGTKSLTETIFGGSGGAGGLISGLFSQGSSSGGASNDIGLIASIGKFFGGFFADGGYLGPGKFGVVGEKGPELAFGGKTGKTIVPPGAGGRTQNLNVNVNAQQGMSRATALQQGRDIGAGIRAAMARND